MKSKYLVISAVADMLFDPIPSVRVDAPRFDRADGSLCLLFYGNGAGIEAVIARLLRSGALPYVMVYDVVLDRAVAIECYAETTTQYTLTEVELPLRDAEWMRAIAKKARRAFELERAIEKYRSCQPVRRPDRLRGE